MKTLFSVLFLVSLAYSVKIENLPGQPKVDFDQYAGYLDVGKDKHHHLHYWFVESQSKPETDPLILWLNGGPGCSSLFGFFGENGPFTLVSSTQMIINPHSWNRNASVLYLESPANNVGYSYTDDPKDINTNDDQTALEKWEGLVEFFKAYPRFRNHDLYITGESYAGTYIPMLADKILENQAKFHINLKGMAIGNGCVDDDLMEKTSFPFLYQHALIDHRLWVDYLDECCDGKDLDCEGKETDACEQAFNRVEENLGDRNANHDGYNMYKYCNPSPASVTYRFKNKKQFWNHLAESTECDNTPEDLEYLNREDVRKVLGVPEAVHPYYDCAPNDIFDYTVQYGNMHDQVQRALTAGIKTMLYYGDIDSVCHIMHGQRFADQFISKENTLKWYKVNGYAAGLWMQEKNLRFVSVRGAGHMVPTDRPIVVKHILDKFIDWKSLS